MTGGVASKTNKEPLTNQWFSPWSAGESPHLPRAKTLQKMTNLVNKPGKQTWHFRNTFIRERVSSSMYGQGLTQWPAKALLANCCSMPFAPELFPFSRLMAYQTGPNLSQLSKTHWPVVCLIAAHFVASHDYFPGSLEHFWNNPKENPLNSLNFASTHHPEISKNTYSLW